MLYPQTINSDLPPVYNPRGYWDWWGYDDPNHAKQSGRQMRAVKSMLDRLASGFARAGATSATQATIGGLASGTRYTFIVRAVSRRGIESSDSNAACATTSGLPPLPGALTRSWRSWRKPQRRSRFSRERRS